jgi:hypothetical protein
METGLESVPEIIVCYGYSGISSWPNISEAKLTGTDDGPFGCNKTYTFNNLWNKKVTFHLKLYGPEFESLDWFEIIKITTTPKK